MNDEVIRISHVSKDFKLPHEKTNSLKSLFTSAHKKKHKGYELQHALEDISFDVKKGEFFGIVGRNGSGKSTLLKIIAEIYRPTKGTLQKRGRLVPFIELGVGFNPELTGRENVYLNGALLGFTTKEIDAEYQNIVEFAELGPFMDQKLKNYSSGMQVRLAFSVATRAEADILLVDEVLAVGDADFQRKCFEYFRELKRNKKTVVFVSHDMDSVREYCDRAVLIDKGSIVRIGDTNKVAENYTKLFTKVDSKSSDMPSWGDARLTSQGVKVHVTENSITIRHLAKVNTNVEAPLFGFKIRNSAGQHITGTNNKIENKKIGQLTKGKNVVVEWSFPNVLSDGSYIVDTAILDRDGVTVIDWWDDAAIFSVTKDRHLPYTIDPSFNLDVTTD